MLLIGRNVNKEAYLENEYWITVSKIKNPTTRLNKRKILLIRLSYLTQYAEAIGVYFIIYDFFRTKEQQKSRYAKGRTEPGRIVTNVNGITARSKHQDWHAFDILILGPQNRSRWGAAAGYQVLGEFWESLQGIWGGRWYIEGKTKFNDVYHFQA